MAQSVLFLSECPVCQHGKIYLLLLDGIFHKYQLASQVAKYPYLGFTCLIYQLLK